MPGCGSHILLSSNNSSLLIFLIQKRGDRNPLAVFLRSVNFSLPTSLYRHSSHHTVSFSLPTSLYRHSSHLAKSDVVICDFSIINSFAIVNRIFVFYIYFISLFFTPPAFGGSRNIRPDRVWYRVGMWDSLSDIACRTTRSLPRILHSPSLRELPLLSGNFL